MGIKVVVKGDWKKTHQWLGRRRYFRKMLEKYGQQGVDALSRFTPQDTGSSSVSWSYEIVETLSNFELQWHNNNLTKDGMPIVILLQYGHGTGTGGYVQGYDFVNPALQPIFDSIADELYKEALSSA